MRQTVLQNGKRQDEGAGDRRRGVYADERPGIRGLHRVAQGSDGRLILRDVTDTVRRRQWRAIGRGLLVFAPYLMKSLSVIGTAAMFMVGGGILLHGVPSAHHGVEVAVATSGAVPVIGSVLASLMPTLLGALAGVITGGLLLVVAYCVRKLSHYTSRP